MKCPSCGDDIPAGKLFCSSCGAKVEVPTLSRAEPGAAVAPARVSDVPLSPARFVPGVVIADRYRIVAQIGRGGMGEVYRADDLRLGQPVALKFLPEILTRDAAALARLHREVRTARQVSHPNVCRVFDIGEADHVPFITMEFVDGEDLASLLRRIGRLQPAKALQLAHQLCAGLAEIHAFGILHRDLKPANIMLDGRGNLRITDFGLAVVAEEIPGDEAHAGTPAYMAPEQLSGEKPTQQSDIYALGLILYELFTGKPAFESLRPRTSTTPRPSQIAKDVDPVVERAILRCLEKEPTARPRTASVVASAFPGGDPLAAAIAAGETPSPEMVAAAVDEPAISVGKAWMLLALFVIATLGAIFALRYGSIDGIAPPEKSADILADNAQQIVRQLGYTAAADSVYWLRSDGNQLSYLAKTQNSRQWWRGLGGGYPSPARLWFRQSPEPLESPLAVQDTEPPMNVPGMVLAQVDRRGRLLLLHAVPPQMEEARTDWPEPDWGALFTAAALPQNNFASVIPKWNPPVACDRQAAWEGTYAGQQFHVTAASFHGRPVYFEVLGPWDRATRLSRPPTTLAEQVWNYIVGFLLAALWIGGLLLARRNWRAGRGDRNGAFKLGGIVLVLFLLMLELEVHHLPTFREYLRFIIATGMAVHFAALATVLYLALEPLVRRRWPDYLVSWTRFLAGRFRNPRVGRDILVGAALGAVVSALEYLPHALPYWFSISREVPFPTGPDQGAAANFIAALVSNTVMAIIMGVAVLALLLIVALLVRKDRLAQLIVILLFLFLHSGGGGNLWIALIASTVHAVILIFLMTRFGLLAAVASMVATWYVQMPLTLDFSRSYFGRSAVVLLLVAGIALWGFRTAVAGRPMFGQAALED